MASEVRWHAVVDCESKAPLFLRQFVDRDVPVQFSVLERGQERHRQVVHPGFALEAEDLVDIGQVVPINHAAERGESGLSKVVLHAEFLV